MPSFHNMAPAAAAGPGQRLVMLLLPIALLVGGCGGGDGLSSAEAQAAAKERVRAALNLDPGSALFADVFVGEPAKGETVLCGTVSGRTADGKEITPRRFIAATDPAQWMKFGPVTDASLPSQPDKFLEWTTTCRGEREVR